MRSSLLFAGLVSLLLILVGVASRREPASADDSSPAASHRPVDLENKTCPVKGDPVVPGITEVVHGAVVHFCCTKCAAKYKANPAAYEAALRLDPAVSQRLDEAKSVDVPAVPAMAVSVKGTEFHDAMRRLWEDHVTWTRVFLISAAADLPDKDAATKRLLHNQDDIGDGIKPFYGDDAGARLTKLLKDHITDAADLVGALKAGDSGKAEALKAKWYANADEIAAFLSGANAAAWPLDAAKSMMHEHLDLTAAEVSARLKKDWDGDVAAYDKVHDQAMKMADMLSDGIRQQFPQKFQ